MCPCHIEKVILADDLFLFVCFIIEIINIPREGHKLFAREVLNISERDSSPEKLSSLSKVVSLLASWVGEENSIADNLSEYVNELQNIANGSEDSVWKNEFKKP